jgi:hypothetical protein
MTKSSQRIFSKKEQDIILDYVLKKLKVQDIFRLRDRFEGQLFLNNTLKRIFTIWTFFELIQIENYQKVKVGFLNTFDFEKTTDLKINFIENFENIEYLIIKEENTLYSYVNLNNRKCCIYTKSNSLEIIKELILKIIEDNKNKIYE